MTAFAPDDNLRHTRPYPFRSQPDRLSPPWRRPHRAVRVGLRAPLRRHLRAAHRGHRPGAFDAGGGAGHHRGHAVAGLDHDEGPFYQMQRMDRYREVVAQMLAEGTAYHCYSSPEEVEAMRERMRAAGEKPRYDGTWRPEPGKTLPAVPADRKPVVRFKNPLDGDVTWDDVVKGTITISNRELDDLVIARPDGTPTYNFCVAVDDWDMQITHVIRGDDHVNNTPRQVNILRAIGAPLPLYGHLPMILGADGQKMSKRKDAVNVMEYPAQGYLPEAILNYLARLGWSHGDEEIFSMAQFCR